MARKRIVYRVHYLGRDERWAVTRVRFDGLKERLVMLLTKAAAVAYAVEEARACYHITGTLTQLVVHNKSGRIAWERTYGQDSKRRKG